MTKAPEREATMVRPVEPALHPFETGNYRIATPAIQAFYDLIGRCLRYRITGALAYGLPRIGKTRAIEYLACCWPRPTHDRGTRLPRRARRGRGGNMSRRLRPHELSARQRMELRPLLHAAGRRKRLPACRRCGRAVGGVRPPAPQTRPAGCAPDPDGVVHARGGDRAQGQLLRDAPGYRPGPDLWKTAIRSCGYVQARQAVSAELTTVQP